MLYSPLISSTYFFNKLMKQALIRYGAIALGALAATPAYAQINTGVGSTLAIGNEDPESIVISLINWVLGILALIAVIFILIGGFRWMTAGGNEESVETAKKILIAAIIGLVIIMAAWGIALYAVTVLGNTTGATFV